MGMTKESLNKMKDVALQSREKNWIKVGYSTCGIAAGADEVLKVLEEEVKAHGLKVKVQKCGCAGLCSAEPLVEVMIEGAPHVFYGKVNKEIAHKIVDDHVCQKKLVEGHIYQF